MGRLEPGTFLRYSSGLFPILGIASNANGSENTTSPASGGACLKKSGSDLLSQENALQVPLAQVGLTSVFGKGTGVTPPLWSPKTCLERVFRELLRYVLKLSDLFFE